ncbi:MAG: ABC transporter ATP-binding protein [Candidatus Nanoarchaeia archaeon]|nr:ABC transporter ATP-binding protein [Candidatus Nanoarchaeia archaeon]
MVKKEEDKSHVRETMKTYFGFLKKYKWIVVAILFIVLIIETRHIIESYLFKVIVDNGTLFSSGDLAKNEFVNILFVVAGVFGIIAVSGFIGRWFQQHFVNMLSSRIIVDIKKKYFNHLIDLDYSFHASHKTGTIISRLSRVSGAVEEITEIFTYNMASVVFSFIVIIASLIYFDLVSAIIIMAVIIVFIGYSYFMQRISQRANVFANEVEDREKGDTSDMFTNIESIKYFGKENAIKRKFSDIINFTKEAFMKHWGYFRWLDSVHSISIGVGTLLLVYFSVTKFLAGNMSLGTIVFIYSVYGGLIDPLYGFVYGLRGIYNATADFRALFEYEKISKEIKDKPDAIPAKIKKGEIEFRNVSFNYGKRKIFENFNLKIPEDKKVALVGLSGSGKTTIVRLLYRLYDINSGEILIDGTDIRDFKQESLRSEMSIVPQECILFDDTIYNNVAFSKPSASKEDVMNAMKFAQLDKVIEKLPDKEQTIVGERGVKLSGGEKQRVSIARALLADKEILVLDEATSSLDSETEFEIQKDLARLMKGRTSIIIAHRLSTIMNADKIIVLKNGEIIQSGKHSELVEQKGEYQRLWKLQKEGQEPVES